MSLALPIPTRNTIRFLTVLGLVVSAGCAEGRATSEDWLADLYGDASDDDSDTQIGNIGDQCPDDPGKTKPGDCGCGVPDKDIDGNGIADCLETCPDDPEKTSPGICGCGIPDDDSDGDGTPDCNDDCSDDPQKTKPGVCGCGIADDDLDGDNTPDCIDECPNDAKKTKPGICGCGVPENKTDSDLDSVPDCVDRCDSDPLKTEPGECGCGTVDEDADSDGIYDCNEACPNDPDKTAPGICGCGTPDDDADGDKTPNCIDQCPNDPNKSNPGVCGCGTADVDSDGDKTPDCLDECPGDPNKTKPGICGCGISDSDTDGDGTVDCLDGCPSDPNKTAPGICGCGALDDGDCGLKSCLAILQENSAVMDGMYQIDPDGPGGISPFEVYCDMTRDGGGWTLIAHVHRNVGMPTPGCIATGGAPDTLGYAIDASGIVFTQIAVTHNGLSQGDFATFTLASETTFDCDRQDLTFLQDNGRYSILFLSNAASGGAGDIPLACFNSSDTDCLSEDRSQTFGAVSEGTGACRVLNEGDGTATNCGAWGLPPSTGDTTWSQAGGRIFIR